MLAPSNMRLEFGQERLPDTDFRLEPRRDGQSSELERAPDETARPDCRASRLRWRHRLAWKPWSWILRLESVARHASKSGW